MVSNVENLNPQLMRILAKEVQSLKQEPLEGIHVLLDDKDITSMEAIIEGPQDTPYFGGRFRVKLTIGKDFPQSPPLGFFLTKIFHPNVSSRGEICVNTLKKDWKSDLGLKHVLLTIKCLLIVPNPESALNEEAGKLLLERYDDYCARAKLYTDIHAKAASTLLQLAKSSSSSSSDSQQDEASANKKACNVSLKKKDKVSKDKKKLLKRL
jgi:ubiquitin-conjugating enzyme E2 S